MNEPRFARTMPQLVRAAAAAYGDEIAITLQDEALTFTGVDRKSAELGRSLVASGVGKGTRIGFICGNGPTFAVILAAITRIGAVAVPISTMIRAKELVRVLRQSDVSGLILKRSFLGYDYLQRLSDALPPLLEAESPDLRIADVPFLRWIATTGDDLPVSVLDMEVLAKRAATVSEALLVEIESEVHPTDQMVEIYTSGSMALPKGVKHNHGPALFRAQYLASMMEIQPSQESAALQPMFWVGGLMMTLLPSWVAGGKSVCTERTMSNSRIAMGSVLADDDMKLMTGKKPYWGLGMSETLGPYSFGDELRASGYPMCAPMDHWAEGYEVRIADSHGKSVAQGQTGEIQVRGYAVTPGLHKLERADHFTPDGYLRTGDLAMVDGIRVHFVGRSGDMIKTASSNVAPAEVEMELQALEEIHNAYVVGLPDKERGQIVAAAVVPRDGATLDFASIEATLRQRLSGYKVPRAYVQIGRDEVPLLHSNKVSRRMLEALVSERLGWSIG